MAGDHRRKPSNKILRDKGRAYCHVITVSGKLQRLLYLHAN